MFLIKTGNNVRNTQQVEILLDQVEELDFDTVSYHNALSGIKDGSCNSRKVNKKIGPTPEKDATNLRYKKKRREQVVKSRKATKIYREYTQWN
jgi:hypothetical protein